MLVYHGSFIEIPIPDVNHSNKFVDFGPGFYVTTFKEQAEKWAKRKAARKHGKAIVNIYEMQEDLSKLRVLWFKNADGAWLDYVTACRKGNQVYENYDIVVGNVADDDVFKSVDMYFRGFWDKERTLQELRYYKRNDQIVFITNTAITNVLAFKGSYEVVE